MLGMFWSMVLFSNPNIMKEDIEKLAIKIYYGQSKEIDLSVDDWIEKLNDLFVSPKKMKEGDIVKIITGNTEYWQPYGEKDSCFIIEEEEPFLWRINKKWAEEVAEKILGQLTLKGVS